MCQMWKTGPYNETKCAECPFTVIPVDELPGECPLPWEEVSELNDTTACQFVDPADDCTFYYLYYYDEARDNATVWVKRHKDCPPPVPVLAIVLGVIAGIVILGLVLLLVWKLLTVLHDRAEYATFNNERLMAKWDTVLFALLPQSCLPEREPDLQAGHHHLPESRLCGQGEVGKRRRSSGVNCSRSNQSWRVFSCCPRRSASPFFPSFL